MASKKNKEMNPTAVNDGQEKEPKVQDALPEEETAVEMPDTEPEETAVETPDAEPEETGAGEAPGSARGGSAGC